MKKYPDSYKQLDPKQKYEVDKLIDKHIEQKKNSTFSKIKKIFQNLKGVL
jgi:hypothetical protein